MLRHHCFIRSLFKNTPKNVKSKFKTPINVFFSYYTDKFTLFAQRPFPRQPKTRHIKKCNTRGIILGTFQRMFDDSFLNAMSLEGFSANVLTSEYMYVLDGFSTVKLHTVCTKNYIEVDGFRHSNVDDK